MTEQECLTAMIPPGAHKPGKYGGGVIQIHVTRACDRACYNCTQGSNLAGKLHFMPPEMFERAVLSLQGFHGIRGVFGGNPCMSPHFTEYCDILRRLVPKEQCGLWSNNPIKLANAQAARLAFDPSVSNLNVHLDRDAYDMFKWGWPECGPVGLDRDSRHSPPFVAMRDVVTKRCPNCDGAGHCNLRRDLEPGDPMWEEYKCPECNGTKVVPDTDAIHELISNCDINKHWSAMLGMFRGELRAWFCEIAGAQSILHQDEPDYPDTGRRITYPDGSPCWFDTDVGPNQPPVGDRRDAGNPIGWWQLPMTGFVDQVRKHCFDCGVPLRGHGELAQAQEEVGVEQCSETHKDIYRPKRRSRTVELVTDRLRLGKPLDSMVKYLQNSEK